MTTRGSLIMLVTLEEHTRKLEQNVWRNFLTQYNLVIYKYKDSSLSQCLFPLDTLSYTGHTFSQGGYSSRVGYWMGCQTVDDVVLQGTERSDAPPTPLSHDHALGIHHDCWSASDVQRSWGGIEEHKKIRIAINTSLIVIKYSSKIDLTSRDFVNDPSNFSQVPHT